MKKQIILLLMLVACVFGVKAQNPNDLYISGTVTQAGTTNPVANHWVYVYSDSMNSVHILDSALTSNLGAYSFNIVGGSVIGPNQVFHVYTQSCNTLLDTAISNNQGTVNTAIADFAICLTNPGGGCQPTIAWSLDSSNNMLVHFFGGVSFFTQGNVTTWSWSFGDGTGSSIQNPDHTFASPGLHTVCLTIATDSGCTSMICDSIYVGSNTGNCTAYFTYQASGLILGFTGFTSSNYPTTWTWDLGDGTIIGPGSSNAVTHTYSASGNYTICLTAVDSTGCTDQYCSTIYVGSNIINSLCGTVRAGGVLLDHGMATLFTIDTLNGSVNWYQSVVLDSSSHYCFLNIPNGNYIVLAEPDSLSSVYNLYFPTYFGDVLNWGDATVITIPGNPAPNWDINLIGFNSPNPGNGNIGGNLIFGGPKGPGDPVPGVEIILYSGTNNELISTVSDDNGQFGFTNLAWGTYTVYPEIPGLNTVPAVVTLSSNNPGALNLHFTVNSDNILAGIEQAASPLAFVSEVYPNPAQANSAIRLVLLKSSSVSVMLYDVAGRLLTENDLNLTPGEHFVNVNAEPLAAGVYSVILVSDDGSRIIRPFVK